jgi:hypothetical protein
MKKILSSIGVVGLLIANTAFAAIAAPSSLIWSITSKPAPNLANVTFSWVDNSNNETSFYAESSMSLDGTFTSWSYLGSVPANTTWGTIQEPYNTAGQCKKWKKYRIKAVNATESSSWRTSNTIFMGWTYNCM